MKRKSLFLVVCMIIVMSFTGCGKKFVCDNCEEEKSGKKHVTDVDGEKITLCDECYKEIQSFIEEFQNQFSGEE